MARVKLSLPQNFTFSTSIPIRITDVNYGGHVGNDAVLAIIHEARVQFLQSIGYTEMNFAGVSLIMSDAAIEFKAEAFYSDVLSIAVAAAELSRVGFDLYYKLMKGESETVVALAKTGMVCFNYELRKVAPVPEEAVPKLRISL